MVLKYKIILMISFESTNATEAFTLNNNQLGATLSSGQELKFQRLIKHVVFQGIRVRLLLDNFEFTVNIK